MTNTYSYAVWRRKSSTAVVKLYPRGKGKMSILKWETVLSLSKYFGWHKYLIEDSLFPFHILWNDISRKYDADIILKWWWLKWQAEALRLAFSRALLEFGTDFRLQLKPHGLLKRNPKIKERKKPWLKKARKSPQWSKR